MDIIVVMKMNVVILKKNCINSGVCDFNYIVVIYLMILLFEFFVISVIFFCFRVLGNCWCYFCFDFVLL